MSTQNSTNTIGNRIRRLRGEESQAAFSEKVGITRSALANYETGRTKPKPSILRRISQIVGVSELVLFGGEAQSFSDLAGALGAYREVGTLPGLTDDEKAIIRILRLCHGDTVKNTLKPMLTALEANKFEKSLGDPLTILEDVARLVTMVKTGFFQRGLTPDTLSVLLEILNMEQQPK